MKLYLLFTIIIATTRAEKYCTGVDFNDRYHNVQILKDSVNRIHQLILNRNDNTLYFIFEQTADSKAAGYYNLDNLNSSYVDGIRNAAAIAIDNINNKVYIGGADGLFIIDNINKIPTSLPVRDDIQSMYFKNNNIFYTNKRKEAFVFHEGRISSVIELNGYKPDDIILDDDNNILFTQEKTLYRVKLGTRAVNIHEKYIVDVIATDNYNKPYICTKDGIYAYNKYKYALDKVSDLTNLRGLAFSKDNSPIYAVLDLIVKLNVSPIGCFEP